MRAFPDLPVVYLFEKTGEDIFIIVGIDYRIDEPKFAIGHDLGVIKLLQERIQSMLAATRTMAINMKMTFLICFVGFLFLYPDDSWCAECRDICDQKKDAK